MKKDKIKIYRISQKRISSYDFVKKGMLLIAKENGIGPKGVFIKSSDIITLNKYNLTNIYKSLISSCPRWVFTNEEIEEIQFSLNEYEVKIIKAFDRLYPIGEERVDSIPLWRELKEEGLFINIPNDLQLYQLRYIADYFDEGLPILTEKDKEILNRTYPHYKWIARDKDGDIFVYEEKPMKCGDFYMGNGYCDNVSMYLNSFKNISYETGPVKFRE